MPSSPGTFDVVGIGAGPSNLSVAALLSACPDVQSLFLERAGEFRWHPGLLLSNATLQNSFLKDLVTPVDPTHECSFLNFLNGRGRLYSFFNANFPRVLRTEFDEYLRWVVGRLQNLRFSTEVSSVECDKDGFVIRVDGGESIKARNIILGVGTRPVVPPCCEGHLGLTVFHVEGFAERAPTLSGKRVVVVGGGQSGAEVLQALFALSVAPSELTWVTRRTNFLPLDESAFVNEMFTPAYAHFFSRQPKSQRETLVDQYHLASDGVSPEVLQDLYRTLYRHQYLDASPWPVRLKPGWELTAIEPDRRDAWRCEFARPSTADHLSVTADVVVLCTGFSTGSNHLLHRDLLARLSMEGNSIRIGSDYAAEWKVPAPGRLFVLNAALAQRGIADPNLALLAWRAARVVNSLAGRAVYPKIDPAGVVEWD